MLGEARLATGDGNGAVAALEKFQKAVPAQARTTPMLLQLARAHLAASHFDVAAAFIDDALVQEPEGPNNAAARELLGDLSAAKGIMPRRPRPMRP